MPESNRSCADMPRLRSGRVRQTTVARSSGRAREGSQFSPVRRQADCGWWSTEPPLSL